MINYIIDGEPKSFQDDAAAQEFLSQLDPDVIVEGPIVEGPETEQQAEDTAENWSFDDKFITGEGEDFQMDTAASAEAVSETPPAQTLDSDSTSESGSLEPEKTYEVQGREVDKKEYDAFQAKQEFVNRPEYDGFDRPVLDNELRDLKSKFDATPEEKERIKILEKQLNTTLMDKLYEIKKMPPGKEKNNRIAALPEEQRLYLDAAGEVGQDTQAYARTGMENGTGAGLLTQLGSTVQDIARVEETPSQILDYDQRVFENVMYKLSKDKTTKGRLNYDNLKLPQKEALLKEATLEAYLEQTGGNNMQARNLDAKYNAINEESVTYMNNANTQIQDFVAEFPNGLPPAEFAIATEIQNDAKKYEADTKTSLNNIKNEFEELQKRQDELSGAYQIDIADGQINIADRFEKTKLIKELAKVSNDQLLGVSKGLNKATVGTARMYLQNTIGFTSTVLGKAGSLLTGDSETYNDYDAFLDLINNNINYDVLNDEATTFGKDGNYSIKETLALGGDMTGYVAMLMNQIKKGNTSSIESAIGALSRTKRIGGAMVKADKDLIMVQETIKMMALDNYIGALDSGLSKNEAFAKASVETVATAAIQTIAPDYNFFKAAGKYAKYVGKEFKGGIAARGLGLAAKNVGTNIGINFAKEFGEEQLEFGFNRLLNTSFALKNTELFSDEFWTEQKQLVAGVGMLSGGLGAAPNYKVATKIYSDVLKVNKQKVTNLKHDLEIKLNAVQEYRKSGETNIPEAVVQNLESQLEYARRMEAVIQNSPKDITGKEIALLVEKQTLTDEMKGADPAFNTDNEARIEAINTELAEGRVNPTFQKLVDKDLETAKKLTKDENIVTRVVDNTGSADKVMKDLISLGRVKQQDTPGGPGFIVPAIDGGANVIILNKEQIYKSGDIATGSHEVLHFAGQEMLRNNPEAASELNEALSSYMRDNQVITDDNAELISRHAQYKDYYKEKIDEVNEDLKNGTISFARGEAAIASHIQDMNEEMYVLFTQALAQKDIILKKPGLVTKLKTVAQKILGKDMPAEFNTGEDMFNFLIGFNKSFKKGKFTDDQKRIIRKGAKGKLLEAEGGYSSNYVRPDNKETKLSMSKATPEMQKLLRRQEEIFMMEGQIGADDLAAMEEEIYDEIQALRAKEGPVEKEKTKKVNKAKVVAKPRILSIDEAEEKMDSALEAMNMDSSNDALVERYGKAVNAYEAALERGDEDIQQEDVPKIKRERKERNTKRFSLSDEQKAELEPMIEEAAKLNKELRAEDKRLTQKRLDAVPTDESVMTRTEQRAERDKIKNNPTRLEKSAKLVNLENKIIEGIKTPLGKLVNAYTKRFYDPIADDAKQIVTRADYITSAKTMVTNMLINEFKKNTINRQGEKRVNDIEDLMFNRGFLRMQSLATEEGIKSKVEGISKRFDDVSNEIAADGSFDDVTGDIEMSMEGKFKITSLLASDARYDQAMEEIKEFWKDNIGNSPIENFKKLPNLMNEIIAEMFGITPSALTARSGNLNNASYRNALAAVTKPYAVFKIEKDNMIVESRVELEEADAFKEALIEQGLEFEQYADQNILQTFFKFLPKLSADDYGYFAGLKDGRTKGKTTGIPNNIIKLAFDNIVRKTTGMGNRSGDLNKLAYNDVLKAIGGFVNDKGEVERLPGINAKSSEGQTFLGMIKLMGRMMTNEISRSTEVGLDPMTIIDIADGKNDLMYSMMPKSMKLLDPAKYGQVQAKLDAYLKKNPKTTLAGQIKFINDEALEILGYPGLRTFNYLYRIGIKNANTVKEITELVGKSWGKAYKYVLKDISFNDAMNDLGPGNTVDQVKLFVQGYSRAMRNQKYLDMKTNRDLFKEIQDRVGEDKLEEFGIGLLDQGSRSFITLNGEKINTPLTILKIKEEGYDNFEAITDDVFNDSNVYRKVTKDILRPFVGVDTDRGRATIEAMSLGQLTPIRKIATIRDIYNFKGPGILEHVISISQTKDQLRAWVDGKISETELDAFFDTLEADVVSVGVDNALPRDGGAERYKLPAVKKELKKLGKPKRFDVKAKRAAVAAQALEAAAIGAAKNSLDPNSKSKGISVWDFDDTLARSESNVLYTMPNNRSKVLKLTAAEFASKSVELETKGAIFDFKEFSEVMNGSKGPLFDEAIARNKKFGNENVFILTARPANSNTAIHTFLKEIGLDIPLENITGLGNGTPKAKADWVVGKAAEGYNNFYFADDHIGNVKAVGKALDKLPVKSKTELAIIKKTNTKFSMNTKYKTTWKGLRDNPGAENIRDLVTTGKLVVGKNTIGINIEDGAAPGSEALNFDFPALGTIEISFDISTYNVDAKLSPKDTFKIFGAVINAVSTKVKSYGNDVNAITFSGLGKSRSSLYTLMAKRYAAELGWKMKSAVRMTTDFATKEMEGNYVIYRPKVDGKYVKQPKVVKEVLAVVDKEGLYQTGMAKQSSKMDMQFNKFLEYKTDIPSFDEIGQVAADLKGQRVGKFDFIIPPSAEDHVGLLYKTLPKGEKGERMMEFYKKNLFIPYAKAMAGIERARNKIGRDYEALKKELNIVPGDLKKTFTYKNENGDTVESLFSQEHAVRVYMWNRKGIDVPGLTEEDRLVMVDHVVESPSLRAFANELMSLNTGEDTTPTASWAGGSITSDLIAALNTTGRKELLARWQANVDVIFQEKNMNKLRYAFGNNYAAALEDSIRRMRTGRNSKPGAGNKETDAWTAWLTNSVGNIMFFNSRSAILQLISATNFINFRENNLFAASKAFFNQKQYWKDFIMLWNSDFLVDRRDGLKLNVNEADLADIAKTQGVQGVLARLLKAGFAPTKYADSFAISTGGATFYRTKYNALIKKGVPEKEAANMAMQEFTEIAQESQQSSRPDKISKEQSQPIGRIVLAFANTPQQYARIIKKASLDLINGRGNKKENIAKIAYYGFLQNAIFSLLQNAMFALTFGDDDEEKEISSKDVITVANSMSSSLMRGLGLYGAVASTVKDISLKMYERSQSKQPKYAPYFAKAAASISPPLGSKLQKSMRAWDTYERNNGHLWDLEGVNGDMAKLPGLKIIGDMTSAITNLPLDRALSKAANLTDMLQEETRDIYRVFNAVGYPEWQLEMVSGDPKNEERYNAEKDRRKVIKKAEKRKAKFDTLSSREAQEVRLYELKKQQQEDIIYEESELNKTEIRKLGSEKNRVNKILEIRSKKRKADSLK